MDSTGVPGYTQVTQEVVDALQGSHFEFKCRGQIKVKGKGDMVTYFLCDPKPSNDIGIEMAHMRHPNYHENANYQGSAINKEIYMKKKNFGNYLEEKPPSNANMYNGINLTENLNYVKREYDNYNKININNHYNINNYNIHGHHQQTQPQVQQYNIRENFNIIENPSENKPRINNYLDRGSEEPSTYSNHYNIMHARNEHEHEPLLTNANVMPKVLYRAEQTNKYEPPQYIGVPFQRTIQPIDSRYRHFQQSHPHDMKKQTNSVPLRYHTSGSSAVEAYMKPLPKPPITNEFNESREMSSTDDLSQSDHRQSISVDSSSDESYSKTTDDCDQSNLKLNMPKALEQKHLSYQTHHGMMMNDEQKAITNLRDLQDYEISSTTDHTISTIPNKGESCNSFEFHDKRELNLSLTTMCDCATRHSIVSIPTAFPKSPFERELQRLLNESAKNKLMPPHGGAVSKTNNLDSTKKNGNNNNGNSLYLKSQLTNAGSLPSSSLGNGNNNNNNIKAKDSECIDTNSLKHPVGLEAIKEMTRNKNVDNQT